MSADGGGKVRVLVEHAYDPSLLPDGRSLVFYRPAETGGADVLRLGLDPTVMAPAPGAVETPVLNAPSNERAPKVHPSGQFLAYESEETGRRELYVTTCPEAQGKWQVSTGGIDFSIWHPDGGRLLYIQGSRLFEVPITLRPAVTIGTPRLVLDEGQSGVILSQGFHLTRNGAAFVVVRRPQGDSETLGIISVVEHWFEEFRSRGATAR